MQTGVGMQANRDLIASLGTNSLADALVAIVHRSGARQLFAMPGEALNPIMESVRKHSNMRLLTVRHEGYGALMASAYAKLSGNLGVCLGAAGPGTTHLVLGVRDATADGAPLLAVSGQVPHALLGRRVFQEIDAARLFASVAHVSYLLSPQHKVATIHSVCSQALRCHTATHLSIPADLLRASVDDGEWAVVNREMPCDPAPPLSHEDICSAADLLTQSGGLVIVVGSIAKAARESVAALADLLGAPIAVLPEGIHLALTGATGNGLPVTSEPSSIGRELCMKARTVLALGTVRRVLAELLSPQAVVVELSATTAPSVHGANLRITGDVAELLELLRAECVRRAMTKRSQPIDPPAAAPALWSAINAEWPADSVLSLEPGGILEGALHHLAIGRRRVTSSFNAGIRGYALPGGIGAACARPNSDVLAVASFDGFSESMAELLTAAKYELPITLVCLTPKDGDAAFDALAYAKSCNIAHGWAPDGDSLARALRGSLRTRGPRLIAVPPEFLGTAYVPSTRRTSSDPRAGTLAARVANALARLGVKRVYGKPHPDVESLVQAIDWQPGLRFIAVQHPESGAIMASAVAKSLAEPTVCIARDEAECILQLNGLYDASFDAAPVLLLAPAMSCDRNGRGTGVAIDELLGEIACWDGSLDADATVGPTIAAAINEAVRHRGVAVLRLVWNQLSRGTPPLPASLRPPTPPSPFLPPHDAVLEATRRLLASPRVLIVAGRGAQGATAELLALSELLAAPVATTMPGRGSVPDSYHGFIGGIGSSGHPAAVDALKSADLVLALGHSARGALFDPDPDAETIRVDSDATQLTASRSTSLALHGDVKVTLAAILAQMRSASIRRSASQLRARTRSRFAQDHRRAFVGWLRRATNARESPRRPIAPAAICHTLADLLQRSGDRAIVTIDVGVTTLWVYRHLIGDFEFIWTSSFGTMGFAVPAAIAVAERLQHRGPVIAIAGDGGICMTLSELATARRLGVPVTAIVFDNGKLAAVKYEQEVMGWPEFGADLRNPDFAQYARACGLAAWRVTAHECLENNLASALGSREPALVDVLCDPHEIPLPAQLHPLQGAGYVVALAREARERLRRRPAASRPMAKADIQSPVHAGGASRDARAGNSPRASDHWNERRLALPPTYRGARLLLTLTGIWLDPLRALGDVLQGGRDLVAFEFASRRLYLVNRPELVREVLERSEAFVKPALGSRFTLWFGREGLVGSAEFRSMAVAAFERRRIDPLVNTIDRVVSSGLARLDYHAHTGQPLSLASEVQRLSLIVSGRALFNIDPSRDADWLNAALDTVQSYYALQPIRVSLGLGEMFPGNGAQTVRSAVARLHAWIDRIIAERAASESQPQDLLSELLAGGRRDQLSREMLRNVVMAAMLSSYETTGCGIAWALICLANHPDHAERVAAEAALLPQQTLRLGDLAVLDHTRRVFQESLRLYPPSWVIVRETSAVQALGDYRVRERSTVLLSPYWIHRHPGHWREPERFEPGRFDSDHPDRHPGAYIPFGAGPHGCFGQRFAELVAQIVLARLVGRYRWRLTSPSPVQPRALISLKPPESTSAVLAPRGVV